MKERWRKFTWPYGRKRTFNPLRWEWRDRILVAGELVAFVTAVAAFPVELFKWGFAPWLLIGATITGTSALLWYAFDLISVGEIPLTTGTARTIRQVISAVEMEKEGATFEWDSIDPQGGIPSDLSNWSRLRPDIKEVMDRYDVPLTVAVQILAAQERANQQDDN